jgi:hypothetical protein
MYIDPAFGGMLLHVIIGIAAVAGAVLFSLRRKIRALFKKDKPSTASAGENAVNADKNDDMVDTLSDE